MWGGELAHQIRDYLAVIIATCPEGGLDRTEAGSNRSSLPAVSGSALSFHSHLWHGGMPRWGAQPQPLSPFSTIPPPCQRGLRKDQRHHRCSSSLQPPPTPSWGSLSLLPWYFPPILSEHQAYLSLQVIGEGGSRMPLRAQSLLLWFGDRKACYSFRLS